MKISVSRTSIEIHGTEHPHACGAIQHADNDGDPSGCAIVVGGRFFRVEAAEARRLEREGVPFAYLTDLGGEVVTVPVN